MTEDLGNGGEQVDTGPDPADPEVDGDLPRPVGVLYRAGCHSSSCPPPVESVSGWCEVSTFPLLLLDVILASSRSPISP